MDNLVNAINNLKINNAGSELNTEITSSAQGDLMRNPDTVSHTSNAILDPNILSFRIIGDVSVFPPPTNPMTRLMTQTLMTPAVKEIIIDATSGNTWKNRNTQKIRDWC